MRSHVRVFTMAIEISMATGTILGQDDNGSLRQDLMAQAGIVKAQFILGKEPFRSCHASTIDETKDYFVTAFFGGTNKSNEDVGIWLCRKEKAKDTWFAPVKVANGIQYHLLGSNKAQRYPYWNPVLYQAKEGPLLLFYKVGLRPCSWWGMLTESSDQGASCPQ